jgi:hypothetical protein
MGWLLNCHVSDSCVHHQLLCPETKPDKLLNTKFDEQFENMHFKALDMMMHFLACVDMQRI